jgi:hypothetical protein
LSKIPIYKNNEIERKLEVLIDQILLVKKENPDADTSKLETEIDQLVYKLYGLNEEEIAIVEED